MSNYTFFGAGRGGGKTTQMMRWIDEALSRGERVAVLVHSAEEQRRIAQLFLDSDIDVHLATEQLPLGGCRYLLDRGYADVYSEATSESARGGCYDRMFVDNADLFRDDPIYLLRRLAPGVPATFTFTADSFDD